jgi:signal transduction histidine kinase
MPPAAIREWVSHFKASEASRQPVQFESRHDSATSSHWLAVTVAFIGPGFSGHTHFSYVAEDVTERKEVETQRAHLLEQHKLQREFLEQLVDKAPLAIAVVEGHELRYTLVNPAYQAIVGEALPLVGRTYPDIFPEAAERGAASFLRSVLESGQPVKVRDFATPIPGKAETWWEGELLPVQSPGGETASVLILTWEITERKRVEIGQRLLAEAGRLLHMSFNVADRLIELAEIGMKAMAEWCAVNLVEADGSIRLAAAAHREPAKTVLIYEFARRYPLEPTMSTPTPEVLRAGQARLYADLFEDLPASRTQDPEYLHQLEQLGGQAMIIAPLVARERVLGSITCVSRPGQPYDDQDVALVEELAHRAALAVDNARLYEAEQQARQEAEETAARITAFQAITAALSEALTPAQVAQVVVEQGITALRAKSGSVALLDQTETTLEVIDARGYRPEIREKWRKFPLTAAVPLADAVRTEEPVFVESLEALAARYPHLVDQVSGSHEALAAVPLTVEGQTLGGLGLSFNEPQAFTPQDRTFILALAQQCAQALERARLDQVEQAARAEAEAGQQRLAVLAEMRERHRLAQELHDTVAQALGYVNLKIAMIYSELTSGQIDAVTANLQELKQVVGETYTDVREEIFNLRAKVQAGWSFMEVLHRYVDKYRRFYNLDIQLIQETDPALFDFPADVTTQLIRTIQEALINVRKHTRVNTAVIRLSRENGQLCLRIEDQGQGFDPARLKDKTSNFGFQFMRERVESVGGRLEIHSSLGQGTQVVVFIQKEA